jgi:hypothetical protein
LRAYYLIYPGGAAGAWLWLPELPGCRSPADFSAITSPSIHTGIAIAGMLCQTGDDLLRLPNYAEPEVL